MRMKMFFFFDLCCFSYIQKNISFFFGNSYFVTNIVCSSSLIFIVTKWIDQTVDSDHIVYWTLIKSSVNNIQIKWIGLLIKSNQMKLIL